MFSGRVRDEFPLLGRVRRKSKWVDRYRAPCWVEQYALFQSFHEYHLGATGKVPSFVLCCYLSRNVIELIVCGRDRVVVSTYVSSVDDKLVRSHSG
jgi:hypothetical protein